MYRRNVVKYGVIHSRVSTQFVTLLQRARHRVAVGLNQFWVATVLAMGDKAKFVNPAKQDPRRRQAAQLINFTQPCTNH